MVRWNKAQLVSVEQIGNLEKTKKKKNQPCSFIFWKPFPGYSGTLSTLGSLSFNVVSQISTGSAQQVPAQRNTWDFVSPSEVYLIGNKI